MTQHADRKRDACRAAGRRDDRRQVVAGTSRSGQSAILRHERRPDYYTALEEAHLTGNEVPFVNLVAEAVEESLDIYLQVMGAQEYPDQETDHALSDGTDRKGPPEKKAAAEKEGPIDPAARPDASGQTLWGQEGGVKPA